MKTFLLTLLLTLPGCASIVVFGDLDCEHFPEYCQVDECPCYTCWCEGTAEGAVIDWYDHSDGVCLNAQDTCHQGCAPYGRELAWVESNSCE
jgi:hypothetical protein